MKTQGFFAVIFSVLVVSVSCKREQEPTPEPDPSKTEITMLIADFDGNGLVPGVWQSMNDGTELQDFRLDKNPHPDRNDTVLFMSGTDANKDWWIGTAVGGNRLGTPFGLPDDASKIRVQFDVYATTATANLDVQFQEADGDVFSWNLGGDGGYQPTAGQWITYQTATLDKFELASWNNGGPGDGKIAPDLLANISLALISGNAPGNTASLYLNNIYFVIEEISDVARPTNVKATPISQTQVNISWTDNSDNEIEFVVERALGQGTFSQIAVVPANTTTYADMELLANTTYSYRVQARSENKQSAYSNIVEVSTLPTSVTQILITDFNGDGKGKVPSGWTITSDGAELAEAKVVMNPIGTSTSDSVFYMRGTDTDTDWWVGTLLLGDDQNGEAFGLPNDISKISVQFYLLAGNETANIDVQLQEKDGDVFTWNFGGDGGYQASQTEWTRYTVPLSAFTISDWANSGDTVLAPELLSNISIALISGGAPGNESIVYINSISFIVSE